MKNDYFIFKYNFFYKLFLYKMGRISYIHGFLIAYILIVMIVFSKIRI